ncbi:MAG: deoxyribonuclease IV [Candidatus Buchananbacteria bacterium]
MKFGTHVSAAEKLSLAPGRSALVGGEIFQFFDRSPQGGPAKPLTSEEIKAFKAALKINQQQACYIHSPYYINLGSPNKKIYYGSITTLRSELTRGSQLGVKYLNTHVGSAKDSTYTQSLKLVVAALKKVYNDYEGSTQLILENAAGAGQIIGDTLEELAEIIFHRDLKQYHLGVCLDTAHAFGSGYDLSDAAKTKKFIKQVEKIIGWANVKLIHGNDSKAEFNSKHDRHADLGQGKIGLACFETLVQDKRLKEVDIIIETPTKDLDETNLNILKGFRVK